MTILLQSFVAFTNVDLVKISTSLDPLVPVVRLGVNTTGDAPLSLWWHQSGTCVSNGLTSDVGYCNDTSDGNSLVAIYPGNIADIRQWGNIGDDSTDNTTAFNAALAAPVNILIPSGIFRVNVLNSPPTNKMITGVSAATSVIKTTSATGDVLPINNGGVILQNIGFTSSVTRTSGCYFNINANQITVDGFYVSGAYCAFQLYDGTSITHIDNGIISNSVGSGQDVVIFGSGTGVGFVDAYFGHTTINSSTPTQNNITILNAGDLVLDDIQSLSATIDLKIAPGNSQSVNSLKCSNSFFDHGGTNMLVQSTGTGSFNRSEFVNCWFGSSSTNGVNLNPGASTGVDGISFTNCQFLDSGGTGLLIQGNTKNIVVGGGSIFAANVNGISDQRNSGFNNVIISNNIIGSGGGFGGNMNGIVFAGSGDYTQIINNSMLGNNSTTLNISNTQTHNIIYGNPPYNPVGVTVPSSGVSPWVIINGPTPATLYSFGGTIGSISINGTALFNTTSNPWVIPLASNDTITIVHSGAPTVHILTQ